MISTNALADDRRFVLQGTPFGSVIVTCFGVSRDYDNYPRDSNVNVIVQLTRSSEIDKATQKIHEFGGTILSLGENGIEAIVTKSVALSLAKLCYVSSVEGVLFEGIPQPARQKRWYDRLLAAAQVLKDAPGF